MTHDEFKRWLANQGATFKEGSKHTIVFLNGNRSTLPRHGRKEVPAGTFAAIKRQLGIK
jgi:mRNA interferase HicA